LATIRQAFAIELARAFAMAFTVLGKSPLLVIELVNAMLTILIRPLNQTNQFH